MAKRKKRNPGNPARATPSQTPQREDTQPAISPRTIVVGLVLLIVAGGLAYLLAGTGDETPEETATAPEDLAVPWVDPQGQSPIVGAVDINPADDSLWFSTNTGIWRVPADGDQPTKVTGRLTTNAGSGDISEQLIVRFRGANRMIGSGHPPAGSDLPPALGMIESDDTGKTWTEISGAGETDYHAIQLSGDAIVAGLFQTAAVELSRDGGKTFEERVTPDPLIDLESDPQDPARLIASTQQGVIGSADEGNTWRELDRVPNVRFTWPEPDALYRIDPGGPTKFSADGGRTWEDRGTTGGEPQAMFADNPDHLLVALIDGTVKESDDGGRTWTDRVTPPA